MTSQERRDEERRDRYCSYRLACSCGQPLKVVEGDELESIVGQVKKVNGAKRTEKFCDVCGKKIYL